MLVMVVGQVLMMEAGSKDWETYDGDWLRGQSKQSINQTVNQSDECKSINACQLGRWRTQVIWIPAAFRNQNHSAVSEAD